MTELAPGARIGPYTLVRRIGEGGMGVVYECTQDGSTGAVAVKLLRPELAQNDAYRRRFQHEVRAAGEVGHPGLVPIVDAGEADGYHYLAMPFVGTRTLKAVIRADSRVPLGQTLAIAERLGSALDAIHERGLVHRDIKSSNILLADADGAPMLSDFGVAKGHGLHRPHAHRPDGGHARLPGAGADPGRSRDAGVRRLRVRLPASTSAWRGRRRSAPGRCSRSATRT